MYCDYIFIKARRALRELCDREAWENLKKQAAKCTVKLPKGPEYEAREDNEAHHARNVIRLSLNRKLK